MVGSWLLLFEFPLILHFMTFYGDTYCRWLVLLRMAGLTANGCFFQLDFAQNEFWQELYAPLYVLSWILTQLYFSIALCLLPWKWHCHWSRTLHHMLNAVYILDHP